MADNPKPKRKNIVRHMSQSDLQKFGNWTDQTDVKVMAHDLKKRGLIGAEQLINDTPNLGSATSIRNAQSDWKSAAIQEILSNARRFNLRTPEEVNANKNVLVQNPRWREGINDPYFNHVHPNFWETISHSILPERYAKFENKGSIAKK